MTTKNQAEFENKQLDINSLPRFTEVEFYPLDTKYLIKLNILSGIGALIVVGALIVGYFLMEEYKILILWSAILFLPLFLWLIYRNFELQKRNGYAIRERDIIFKRGSLHEKITIVPFNRVQHVSARKDLLDKFLGISSLTIFSAGGSASDVTISGLLARKAEALKEAISKRVSSNE